MFKFLKLFRKTNSLEIKSNYIEAQKNYKNFCKIKRRLYYNNILCGMNNASDSKRLWKAINSFKSRNEHSVRNIATEDWVTHFKALLNPPLTAAHISYAEPLAEVNYLDKVITIDELKSVLVTLKDNKAPWFDRVPYKFYKMHL